MTVDYGSAQEADAGDVTCDVHRFAALLLHPVRSSRKSQYGKKK
jgi:hypothetical protein